MTSSAVLGAAAGTGLALLVALTIILYRYRRRTKDWGDLDRFENPRPAIAGPSRACIQASEGGFGKCPYGTQKHPRGQGQGQGSADPLYRVKRWDRESRGSRTSTKSCPPVYTYPQQEFNVNSEQRIVQPLENSLCFASLPEVREVSFGEISAFGGPEGGEYFFSYEQEAMLKHQSQSLPPGSIGQFNRTASVSSQGSTTNAELQVRKGHRGSSPAIRTFTPEGVSAGVTPPDSPPLIYHGSRSPSPVTNIRGSSLETNGSMKGSSLSMSPSPKSSSGDLRISPLGDKATSQSQFSLNSLGDRINSSGGRYSYRENFNNFLLTVTSVFSSESSSSETDLTDSRRGSRCLSPLLIPPRSPTASDGSSQSPIPLSPLLGTLQVELYQKKDVKILLPAIKQAEYCPADPYNNTPLGQLRFILKYDFDKSDLHVHIIEAKNLAVSNEGGFNDPYVRLFLSPEVDSRKRQTSIHRNEQSPVFDEHFKFPVSQDDLKEKVLFLQVYDYDRYSRNDVVGQVSFRLDEYNVTTNLEIWADVIKDKKPSGERQEILISLSYLPSAERLTVVLLKARNLFTPLNKDKWDPFVKVYLTGAGKRLKKKKTTARKGTNNPVWNEAVSFSISSSSLANASLEICVMDQSNELMGSNALIGTCTLGPRENGQELAHWQQMSGQFRKSIAMWHVIT